MVAPDERHIGLELQNAKPIILQDNGDLFTTSAGANRAFHFYLMSRMAARGTLQIGLDTFDVAGLAWLDRAWGAIPLPRGQLALNRFMLQLDDGREILCLQLRRQDGSGAPITTGLLLADDGSIQRLGRRDISMEVLDYWTSSQDGTRYPARWRLRVPAEAMELDILPYVADQELKLSVRYWGGAVQLEGKANGQNLNGSGYVELTAYAESHLAMKAKRE